MLIRYEQKWFKIDPKPYEVEKQTQEIAWHLAKGLNPEDAYRKYFEKQRKQAKVLYPSFRKDGE